MEPADPAAPPGSPPVAEITNNDYVGIYLKLRTALEPARTYSVSLHDADGEAEWLSESSLGPDEHRAALDALALFEAEEERAVIVQDLGSARSALVLRVANYEHELLGAVMLIVDSRTARHLEGNLEELLTLSGARAAPVREDPRNPAREAGRGASRCAGPGCRAARQRGGPGTRPAQRRAAQQPY